MSKDLKNAVSNLSVQPSATPSCRRLGWSTTTLSTASGTRKSASPSLESVLHSARGEPKLADGTQAY